MQLVRFFGELDSSMKSLNEGTVFAVPYGLGSWALGVVARRQPRGSVIAAYIFHDSAHGSEVDASGALPDPANAAFRGRMSDYYIRSGLWRTLGVHAKFRRELWPFDRVGHRDAVTGRCKIVLLDDRNPLKIKALVDDDCSTADRLPGDTIYAPDWLMKSLLPGLDGTTDTGD
jgi:hypothetical protein